MQKLISHLYSIPIHIKNLLHKISFQIKNAKKENSSVASLEKDQIAKSLFWDAQWYVQTYQHPFNRAEALEYWYNTGWHKGETPSRYFDRNYINFACSLNINPIILYEGHGARNCFPAGENMFKFSTPHTLLQDYVAYKPTRKAKGVVYTCITNDYDDIHEIETYTYVDKEWDYVCFTDDKEDIAQGQIGIWQIRPLQFAQLDNTRNNRYHKINPHLLFPEYQQSIYIDSNINILSPFLFNFINDKHADFILPAHFKNTCIYQEYEDVLVAKLDKPSLITQELHLLKQAGMPKQYGFCENNVLYRRHHQPQIIALMQDWWNMVLKYSKRDQLSLAYILWKHHLNPQQITFTNTRFLTRDFYVFGHKKGQ